MTPLDEFKITPSYYFEFVIFPKLEFFKGSNHTQQKSR